MSDYRLYVFVKTSLDSMTPGRIAAQVCHAGSRFNSVMERRYNNLDEEERIGTLEEAFQSWKDSTTQDFGTTIVLDGKNLLAIRKRLDRFKSIYVSTWETIIDPEYGIPDGLETIYVPMDTCIYLFCHTEDYTALRQKESFYYYDFSLL